MWERDGRRNVFDCFCSDEPWVWDIYACSNLGSVQNVYCSDCLIGQSLYYSFNCLHCSYCLGCNGLIHKQFCIFNKQYSKEEWFVEANKIFAKMDEEWVLGDVFPGEMNPFYFNDTPAYLIDDSFTKSEVAKDGYLRRDEEIKVDIWNNSKIIYPSNSPKIGENLSDYQWFDEEWNRKIDEEIMKKVIKDEKGNYYKIVKMEYEFLSKYWLPLPELHWLERIKMGFKIKS